MKSIKLFLVMCLTVLTGLVCQAEKSPALGEGEHYLAHNLWFEKADNVPSINYKRGTMLPAGSVISRVRVETGRRSSIMFHHKDYGMDFTIQFNPKYHGNLTVNEYKDRMITDEPIEKRLKGMSAAEKDAIEAGQIYSGMSRDAVLIAWGYPPEHRTPSLKLPSWVYWTSRFVSRAVTFGSDDKTN